MRSGLSRADGQTDVFQVGGRCCGVLGGLDGRDTPFVESGGFADVRSEAVGQGGPGDWQEIVLNTRVL